MQQATANPTKQSLSPSQRQLIELMQRVNYGRIERLHVRRGQPILDPPPRIVREVKFCGENGPRPEIAKSDFVLKNQVLDLLAHLEAMGSGTIERLEVKGGLPFLMVLEEVAA